MGMIDGMRVDRILNQIMTSGTLDTDQSSNHIKKLASLGKTAIPRIAQQLNTTSQDGTELVIDLLTELLNESTMQYYRAALADSNPRVVTGVVKAMVNSSHVDPNRLVPLIDEPAISKPAILQILTAHKNKIDAAGLLRYAYKLENNEQAMLFRIIEEVADEPLVPELINRIDTKDHVMRTNLVKVISRFDLPIARDALYRMLDDEHKGVRLAALEGLAESDSNPDVERLCRLLMDTDFKIQSKAVEAIVKLNNPATVKHLIEPLQQESEYTRRAAVEVLNEIANPESIKDLLNAIRDEDWWVRSRAADALGKIGGKRVVDSVIDLIKDDDEFVRRSAIEIINATKDERTFDALVDALSDSDWWVRERAVDALANLGNPNAVPVLIKMLETESENEKLAIIVLAALGKLESTDAIDIVKQQLRHSDSSVRREALATLGQLTTEAHADTVIHAIHEFSERESEDMRELANKVMHQIHSRHSSRVGSSIRVDPDAISTQKVEGTIVMSGTVVRGDSQVADKSIDPSKMRPNDVLADRYRFIKQIGKGAFGTVFLMEDQMINETLILKFLNAQFARDESILKRFIYELRFARKITHPNVIRIYDMITFGDSSAISMEYFESHTLNSEIKKGLDVDRTLKIVSDVCSGMESAHAASVVHRDLKPNNILIDDNSIVKIVDFGVASATQSTDTKLTKTGLLIGTPTYMAPEQVLGKKIDERTDIYSLGIIMYEMLTGKPPYVGGDSMAIMYQHVQGKARDPREVNPDIPDALSDTVLKALKVDPDMRFQSMGELLSDLQSMVTAH